MDSNIENEIHPGPINQTLLTDQCNHRSSLIWQSESSKILETSLVVRRSDSMFWNLYESTPMRVKELIDMAGFGGVARAGYYTLDWKLITALVERWRPETHTFHLTCGEVTITLQDVAIIWGLPVDGEAIIGPICNKTIIQWQDICHQLLGFRPDTNKISGNKLVKSVLDEHLATPLPADANENTYHMRARGLILLLIGGLLFSEISANMKRLPRAMNVEPEANEMLAIIPFTSGAGTSGEGTSTRDGTESQPQVVVPFVRRPRRVRKTVSRYTPC